MNPFQACAMVVASTFLAGCGTYEYRKRPDASEVAVIRDIQKVFPEFASEVTGVLEGLKVPLGPSDVTLGKSEISNNIVRLYEEKDQLNAQLRDFVVARYQSYINAELDSDKAAREIGRKNWNDVTSKIHATALELRKIKEAVTKAGNEHVEEIEKSKDIQGKAIDSKKAVLKTGNKIQDKVESSLVKNQEPRAKEIMHQVRLAKGKLEEGLEYDEVPKVKDAAARIQGGVSQIPILVPTPPDGIDPDEAIELQNGLQNSVDRYIQIIMKRNAEERKATDAERNYNVRLEEAIHSLEAIRTELLVTPRDMSP